MLAHRLYFKVRFRLIGWKAGSVKEPAFFYMLSLILDSARTGKPHKSI